MARVKDIVSLLNNVAPETNVLKDEYDNVELLVGRADAEVKRVLCCLDATEEVISEAGELGGQLIVAEGFPGPGEMIIPSGFMASTSATVIWSALFTRISCPSSFT